MNTYRVPEGMLGSFAHVDKADPDDLVERLDTMHALDFFRAYKQETFDLMRLRPGSRVADVGCGTGEDAWRLVDLVGETGRVVGYDMSDAMLEEAARRRGGAVPNLSFRRSRADQIDAVTASFDSIRADRVLTHVSDASAALREMMRVVKPGGRVVVSEPDMPGCWVTNRYHEISARIMQSIAMSCEQPFIARELYNLFRDVGLVDVTLSLRSLVMTDPKPMETIFRFSAAMEAMIRTGELTIEEAGGWSGDFEERRRAGRFLAGGTMFIVAGVKADRAAV